MVLMRVRKEPVRGVLEGVGPGNRDFFGPRMATSECNRVGISPINQTTVLDYYEVGCHWMK
jgi:hypothetical protein